MRSAFEVLEAVSDEDLARRGLIRLNSREHHSLGSISKVEVRGDMGVVKITIAGTEHQYTAREAERVLAMWLMANGLPVPPDPAAPEAIAAPAAPVVIVPATADPAPAAESAHVQAAATDAGEPVPPAVGEPVKKADPE